MDQELAMKILIKSEFSIGIKTIFHEDLVQADLTDNEKEAINYLCANHDFIYED